MYRYETHLHTAEGSACSATPAAEQAYAHKVAGYDGIFVTDHWFNSSTTVPRDIPWEQRIELYCKGYENALKVGEEIGLAVFQGIEYTVQGADFLFYGIDKQWMLDNEFYLTDADERDLFAKVRAAGGFVVQAHPFREANYIPHISLYPHDVDAVEIYNMRNKLEWDIRAEEYAKSFGLRVTSGSDTHNKSEIRGGGILVPEPIKAPDDYYRQLIEDKIILVGDEKIRTSYKF